MRHLIESPFFSGIPVETIEALVKHLPKRTVKAKEMIIQQDTKAKTVYILVSGKVEVFYTAKNGKRATFVFHQAPFILGQFKI